MSAIVLGRLFSHVFFAAATALVITVDASDGENSRKDSGGGFWQFKTTFSRNFSTLSISIKGTLKMVLGVNFGPSQGKNQAKGRARQ